MHLIMIKIWSRKRRHLVPAFNPLQRASNNWLEMKTNHEYRVDTEAAWRCANTADIGVKKTFHFIKTCADDSHHVNLM